MKRGWDINIGFLVAMVSAAILISLPYQEWARGQTWDIMAPEFFPRLILISLILFGLLLAATAQFSKNYVIEVERIHAFVLIPIGIAAFYTATFHSLGFIVATILTIASLMLALGERRLLIIATVAIFTSVIVDFAAESGLKIMLP